MSMSWEEGKAEEHAEDEMWRESDRAYRDWWENGVRPEDDDDYEEEPEEEQEEE